MAPDYRLARWTGLATLTAALAAVLLAVLLPGGSAAANDRSDSHCPPSHSHGQSNEHGPPKPSAATASCQPNNAASGKRPATHPHPGNPGHGADGGPAFTPAPPRVPTSVTTGAATSPPPSVASAGAPVALPARLTPTSAATSTEPTPHRGLAAETQPHPRPGDGTSLPATLVAFALGVAAVVLAAGYRKRGALLAAAHRPRAPGTRPAPRHRR